MLSTPKSNDNVVGYSFLVNAYIAKVFPCLFGVFFCGGDIAGRGRNYLLVFLKYFSIIGIET